jgi:deoxyguanosine kinase
MQQDLSYYLDILQCDQRFLMPDAIVYVTASEEVINQRIVERSKNSSLQWYGDLVTLNFNLTDSYKLIFDLVNIPIVYIDTSKDSIEESYFLLCHKLNNLRLIGLNISVKEAYV